MTAALHPILADVPGSAHPVTCPIPGCASPPPIGRMWRDRPHVGRPRLRWHGVVTDEPGVVFDGESGYSAAHWVLTSHVLNAHDQLTAGGGRARVALLCNRAAIEHGRTARGLKAVTLRDTAECAECQTGLTLSDDGWWDEHGSNVCPNTRQMCPHLCHPHADGPGPVCGVCLGHGEVYDTHLPCIDTRTPGATS